MHEHLEAVYRPSSPFARPSLVPPDQVRIVATRGDKITGLAQAERLGDHFGIEPTVVPGSHLLQMGIPWTTLAGEAAGWLKAEATG